MTLTAKSSRVAAAVVFGTCCQPAYAEPCDGGAERTEFGKWQTVEQANSDLSVNRRRAEIITSPTTRYLRLLIELRDTAPKHWNLTIRDPLGRVLETAGPDDFAAKGELLTNRHAGSMLSVEVTSSDGQFPTFVLRQQIIMPFNVEGAYYSRKVEGVDDWLPLFGTEEPVPEDRRRWGDNVAFLMVGLQEGVAPASCSGIALPPFYVLTNWHCGPAYDGQGKGIAGAYWNHSICERTLIDLSWDGDTISREFICENMIAKNAALDYALLKVRSIDQSSAIGPVRLSLDTTANSASLVHHPAAADKKISADCRIVRRDLSSMDNSLPGVGFSHRCDSENGSSGGPLFSNRGDMIGLHHMGFAVDPVTKGCDDVNKAIWIKSILADLEAKSKQPDNLTDDRFSEDDWHNIKLLVRP